MAGRRYLLEIPGDERGQALERARGVASFLRRWSARWGDLYDRSRCESLGLTVCAATGWLPDRDLCDLALIPFWIFTVDACLDGGQVPAAERRVRVRRYAAAAAADRTAAACAMDPCAASLADITERLARRRLFRLLGEEWAAAVLRMLRAMAWECELGARLRRGGGGLPSLRAYLRHGRESIGVPAYLTGLWIIDGDPRTAAHLPGLRRLAGEAARALRLANDLRTEAKERAEGNANALLLLEAGGMSHERAATAVRQMLNASLERVRRAETHLPPIGSVRAVGRVARFAAAFYHEHDFHTFRLPDGPRPVRSGARSGGMPGAAGMTLRWPARGDAAPAAELQEPCRTRRRLT